MKYGALEVLLDVLKGYNFTLSQFLRDSDILDRQKLHEPDPLRIRKICADFHSIRSHASCLHAALTERDEKDVKGLTKSCFI
jgi:hypothetical protein